MHNVEIKFKEGSRENLMNSFHSFYLIWLLRIELS